jgi:hypothetical protein
MVSSLEEPSFPRIFLSLREKKEREKSYSDIEE